MIRRAFIRALSGAILTTLLGVKAWRLEVKERPSEEEVRLFAEFVEHLRPVPTMEYLANKTISSNVIREIERTLLRVSLRS